jgi:hypothetical protein
MSPLDASHHFAALRNLVIKTRRFATVDFLETDILIKCGRAAPALSHTSQKDPDDRSPLRRVNTITIASARTAAWPRSSTAIRESGASYSMSAFANSGRAVARVRGS